jgi:hypothetical protein
VNCFRHTEQTYNRYVVVAVVAVVAVVVAVVAIEFEAKMTLFNTLVLENVANSVNNSKVRYT